MLRICKGFDSIDHRLTCICIKQQMHYGRKMNQCEFDAFNLNMIIQTISENLSIEVRITENQEYNK